MYYNPITPFSTHLVFFLFFSFSLFLQIMLLPHCHDEQQWVNRFMMPPSASTLSLQLRYVISRSISSNSFGADWFLELHQYHGHVVASFAQCCRRQAPIENFLAHNRKRCFLQVKFAKRFSSRRIRNSIRKQFVECCGFKSLF